MELGEIIGQVRARPCRLSIGDDKPNTETKEQGNRYKKPGEDHRSAGRWSGVAGWKEVASR